MSLAGGRDPAVPAPPAGRITPDSLMEEFPPFQVWIDFRPMEDGDKHWHARQPDWKPADILSAYDGDGMRRELIIWTRQQGDEPS